MIIGIRPEDLEDAALETDAPPDRILAGQARAPRGARLGDHGALRDQGRPRRDRRDARDRARTPAQPRPTTQIGAAGGRGGHRRPLQPAFAGQARRRRSTPSSTRARCTSSIRDRATASTTPRKERIVKQKWLAIAALVAVLAVAAGVGARASDRRRPPRRTDGRQHGRLRLGQRSTASGPAPRRRPSAT